MATHVDGTVLDWNAVAAEHPEYFLADGLHLRRAGGLAYAALPRTGPRVRS